MEKVKINFDEFMEISSKLEIKIGLIESAERVPKSNGLKLVVDFWNGDIREVFTNIGKTYEPDDLIGLTMPFITNLEPVEIKGVKSEAMIMVGKSADGRDQIGLDYVGAGTILM